MHRLFLFLYLLPAYGLAQPGLNWLAPMTVGTPNNSNLHPRIALDANGDPLVIWGDVIANKAWFSRWDGSGFTPPQALNPASIPVFSASWAGPQLASHGDTVYAVFKKKPENVDTNHVFLVRSFDGGQTFMPPVRVDYIADSLSRFPVVAADNTGHPVVGFMKFDPGFGNPRWVVARSNDHGSSFSQDVPGSGHSGGLVCDCCPASISGDGSTMALLYRDNLNNLRNSWAGISTSSGAAFAGGIQVDQTNWVINSCPASGPDGVVIGDTLVSVYMSEASGSTRVYWSKSSIPGLSFVSGGLIAGSVPGLQSQNYVRIARAGTAVAIVWKQVSAGADVIPVLFTDNLHNGFASAYDTVAFGNTGSLTNADVAMAPGAVHVVWQGSNSNLWYRKGLYGTTGISTGPEQGISIFPNPANDFLQVTGTGHAGYQWRLSDLAGRTVRTGSVSMPEENPGISVATLLPGTYILTLRGSGMVATKKVVVR